MLTVINGDAMTELGKLPISSVQCCVTSPPYWGLRDYGIAGQLGMEETPEEWVAKMVEIFREVKRVLRDDGTLWLNLGDSYANDTKWGGQTSGKHVKYLHGQSLTRAKKTSGLKSKDLVGIPWRVAFALQAAGWYLRSDIIWHKPNPMPESVTDRPTKSHEYIFLLTKSERYYYSAEAIREPVESDKGNNRTFRNGGVYTNNRSFDNSSGYEKETTGNTLDVSGFRNKRTVWTIATQPYAEAHFATFPEELPKLCILAGSKVGDTVLDPFAGSGTTLRVALELGRKAMGIELSPEYCKLIEQRSTTTLGML